MSAYRKRSSDNPDLVGRIDSEHLSEQFQRELSNSPGEDLLQDDLRIDDISNASGSGVTALAQTLQPKRVIRPEILASMDVSDDNWLVASPLTSPTPSSVTGQNRFHDTDRQSDSRGGASTAPAIVSTKLERSPSKALTDAYAQPSKIPRLSQATSAAGPIQRQPSRGLNKRSDTTPARPITRSRSGAVKDIISVPPAPGNPNVAAKPPYASPSRSASDNGEDGQPEWRAVSKPPAPKYSQQTDIALGGPFERSSSSQLPRANSSQKSRPRSRPTSRPASAKAAQPQEAEPSAAHFQSRLLVAPPQADNIAFQSDPAQPSSNYDNDGRFASGFAQVGSQEQPVVTDEPVLQQPVAVEHIIETSQGTGTHQEHMNGIGQRGAHDSVHQEAPTKEQEDSAQHQQPVSPNQVQVSLPTAQSSSSLGAEHTHGSGQAELEQEQMHKAKKCCCCVIM